MSNLLLSYLNKRMNDNDAIKKRASVSGPVITISREVGCNGVKLAKLIAARLNSMNANVNWKVVSKEIFHKSAIELKMDTEHLQKTIKQSEKSIFNEILKAFSDKNYKSARTIGKAIKTVIHDIAADGYCIIVGRAGHVIAKNIKNALHIRLVAPLPYRMNTIMQNNHLNKEEAVVFIHRVDKERMAFRKSILNDNPQNELFDITINRAVFSDEEIIDLIVYAANKRIFYGLYPK